MPSRPPTPSFKRPPVTEVALGVQFKEPLPLRAVDYGPLWDLFRERYPEYEEQPPLARVLETFGDEPRPDPQALMNAAAFPQAPVRLWFVNTATGGLIQIQRDRFVFNWRKSDSDSEYPRFSWVKTQFQEEYGRFLQFLDGIGIQSAADICEVTYVNHIVDGEGWRSSDDPGALVPALQLPELSVKDSAVEDADLRIRFKMAGIDGQFGRLHFRVHPAIRTSDDAKLLVVNFIARRRSASSELADVLEALHDGHDWIVLTFKDITSADMHEYWGIEDANA